ncbi:type IV pilus assembly protein PilE [Oryzomicrobium terrae]|uniref:Type IV pilus assembly protein PilE n=1 Tax=Oryzomicrobium terrae TaxID=1735038 RepID=A0A5C1E5T8_9RHOO|nr:type IV pilin protein [Oryzomicrobium terrae]QEL64291.1 type IV pilus assembly protein PilE [Oryzomicrobium terrae]
MTAQTSPRAIRGFTLMELMITVAIVAILAAVAYPSYRDYIKKGKRASAQAVLMDIAAKEHNFLLVNRTYAFFTDLTATTQTDIKVTVPTEIQGDYTFSVAGSNSASPPTFTVSATPKGSMAGDVTLTVDQTGAKTPAQYWSR